MLQKFWWLTTSRASVISSINYSIDRGYDVLLAESGWKGLELFYQERPDLKMAGIDGVTTLEQVLRLNPDQLVIIVTGTGTPEIEQQVRGLDVTASC
jgi:DNA-binding response OmpR family regulator